MLADTKMGDEETWKVVWNDFQKAPYMYKGQHDHICGAQ